MNLRFFTWMLSIFIAVNVFSQENPTKAERDASDVIRLVNSVIDLGNSYSQSIKNFSTLVSMADGNVRTYSQNPDLPFQGIRCNAVTAQPEQHTAYAEALKAAPAFPEKAEIEKYVAEGKNDIEVLTKWCEQLSDYFHNKGIEEDKQFEKYTMLRDSFNYYIDKSYTSWGMASGLASDAGNRAELVFLEKSPLAAFVIPMKTDLNSLDAILKMFNDTSVTSEGLKAEVAKLQESIKVNNTMEDKDVKKLSDLYYKSVFETFYKNLSATANTLNDLIKRMDTEDDPEVLNGWFRSATSSYVKAIEEYNTFVGQ